jgi:hypothetical protein
MNNLLADLFNWRRDRLEGVPSERAVTRALNNRLPVGFTADDGSHSLAIYLDAVYHTDGDTGETRKIAENSVEAMLVVCTLAQDDEETVYSPTNEHGQPVPADICISLNPQGRKVLARVLSIRSRLRQNQKDAA